MCRKMRISLPCVIAVLLSVVLLNTACSQFPFRPQRATATPVPPTVTPTKSAATLAAQSAPTNTPKPAPQIKLVRDEFPEVGFAMKYPDGWETMRSTTAPEMVFISDDDDANLRVVVAALADEAAPGALPGILEALLEEIGAEYPNMEIEDTSGTVTAIDARGQFQTYVVEQGGVKVRQRLAVLANETGRGYRVLMSAPASEFAHYADTYDKMLESFAYLAAPAIVDEDAGKPPIPALPLVKYDEDFAMFYPEGWQVYPSAAQPEILIAPQPPAPDEVQNELGVVVTHLGSEAGDPDSLLTAYSAAHKGEGFVQVDTREAVLAAGATGSLEHYHAAQDADMAGEPLHYTVSFLMSPDARVYRVVQYCPLAEYDKYAETFKEMRLSFTPVVSEVPVQVTFAGDCEDVTLPALAIAPRDKYPAALSLMSLADQETCELELQQTVADEFHAAASAIYYERRDTNGAAVVMRISFEGQIEPLSFTASAPSLASYNFLVSADGARIAWSMASEMLNTAASVSPRRFVNDVYVADINGENQIRVLESVPLGDEQVLRPVRFSADGTALYLAAHLEDTFSPVTQWNALMRVRFAAPNQLEQIFNCGAGNSGCIHDFSPDERWIAYQNATGQMALRAVDSSSDLILTAAAPGNVLCCGKFNPAGADFVYYVADGTTARLISQPPVPGAASQVLTQGPRLAPFVAWADDTKVIFGVLDSENIAGHRLLNLHTAEIVPLNGDYLEMLEGR